MSCTRPSTLSLRISPGLAGLKHKFSSAIRPHHSLPCFSQCARLQCSAREKEELNDAASTGPSPFAEQLLAGVGKSLLVACLAAIQTLTPLAPDFLVPRQQLEANAVLLSPETRLPRNAEIALRKAVPVTNAELRSIQNGLEEIFPLLRIPQRKPYGTMERNVKKAIEVASSSRSKILGAVPAGFEAQGDELFGQITSGRYGLEGLLSAIQNKDAERTASRLASTLDSIAELAKIEAPGLPFLVPSQYDALPRLTGRATVQLTVTRPNGGSFTVQNGAATVDKGELELVLDGFSAPLTAGNFVAQILSGAYDGVSVRAANMTVLADSKSESESTDAVDLPLEILPAGDFQPLYRTFLEVQDGELPVLPLSVFGSVAMAHSPTSETSNSPTQFFIYLYDKRSSGLGGIAFDEGQFSVFGFVTKGKEILPQIQTGDTIQSVRLTSGQDRLVNVASS